MGLHSKRHDITRRARYSLGHIRMSVEDLGRLIDRWETICGSVTISIGDGVVADFADDLYEATKYEVDHLVIRTEEPATAISLKFNKAELAYIDDPQTTATINTIKSSLKPFKIAIPFYRLRAFWAWIYVLFITVAFFLDYHFHGFQKAPLPPATTNGAPPPPLPPLPPPFPGSVLIVLLVTLILLSGWFIYAYQKLDSTTSARIVRKSRKANNSYYDEEPPSNPSQGI